MLVQTVPGALQDILNSQMDAWRRGDASAFVQSFAADATFVSVRGDIVRGRPAIEANHAFIFSGPYKNTRMQEVVELLIFTAPTVAVAHLAVQVSGIATLPPGIPASGPGLLRTTMTYVFVQAEDTWRILAAQNTIVAPPAAR